MGARLNAKTEIVAIRNHENLFTLFIWANAPMFVHDSWGWQLRLVFCFRVVAAVMKLVRFDDPLGCHPITMHKRSKRGFYTSPYFDSGM